MSFKTRLFASHALIVVICLGLVAIAMSLLLQGYRDRLIMERLDNIARPVSVQIRSLVNDNISEEKLWTNLEEQAITNNVYILLLSDGIVIRQFAPSGETMIETPLSGLPIEISHATQGKFETSDGKTYILKEGDCYFFDSNKPHYSRTLGDKPGKILMVFAVQKASAPGGILAVNRNRGEDAKNEENNTF